MCEAPKQALANALGEQREPALIPAVPRKGTAGTTSKTVLGLPDGRSVLQLGQLEILSFLHCVQFFQTGTGKMTTRYRRYAGWARKNYMAFLQIFQKTDRFTRCMELMCLRKMNGGCSHLSEK